MAPRGVAAVGTHPFVQARMVAGAHLPPSQASSGTALCGVAVTGTPTFVHTPPTSCCCFPWSAHSTPFGTRLGRKPCQAPAASPLAAWLTMVTLRCHRLNVVVFSLFLVYLWICHNLVLCLLPENKVVDDNSILSRRESLTSLVCFKKTWTKSNAYLHRSTVPLNRQRYFVSHRNTLVHCRLPISLASC
jgi:hypothetical protein